MIVNRRNCGELSLRTDEAKSVFQIIRNGCGGIDELKISGQLYDPCGDPPPKRKAKDD